MATNGKTPILTAGRYSSAPRPLSDDPNVRALQLHVNQLGAQLERLELARQLGQTHAGKRDTWEVFGYPESRALDANYYWQLYERDDVGGRIIDLYPDYTWKDGFILIDGDSRSDKPNNPSQFIAAWIKLAQQLGVWRHFKAVDKLARLGRFAVLLIGAQDGTDDFSQPVGGNVTGIAYLSVFGEPEVEIKDKDLETDKNSERFGLPNLYHIDFSGQNRIKQPVHYSRVIHVAHGRLKDDVYGRPNLKRAINRLIDKDKVAGGGAEAFWLNIRFGLAVIAEEGFPDDSESQEAFRAQVDNFVHNLSRVMRLRNVQVEKLAGEVVDASGMDEVVMRKLAIATGIPKRILEGSEEGQLAGSQDERAWYGQVESQRRDYAGPGIVEPFIQWCLDHNVLPEPQSESFSLEWPSLFELSAREEAETDELRASAKLKRAQALQLPKLTRWREEYGEGMDGIEKIKQEWEASLEFDDNEVILPVVEQ